VHRSASANSDGACSSSATAPSSSAYLPPTSFYYYRVQRATAEEGVASSLQAQPSSPPLSPSSSSVTPAASASPSSSPSSSSSSSSASSASGAAAADQPRLAGARRAHLSAPVYYYYADEPLQTTGVESSAPEYEYDPRAEALLFGDSSPSSLPTASPSPSSPSPSSSSSSSTFSSSSSSVTSAQRSRVQLPPQTRPVSRRGVASAGAVTRCALTLPTRPPPLSVDEWHACLDASGRVVREQWLRERVFYGGVSTKARPLVWPYLLGCLDPNMTTAQRAQVRSRRATEFAAYRWQWSSITPIQEQRFKWYRTLKEVGKLSLCVLCMCTVCAVGVGACVGMCCVCILCGCVGVWVCVVCMCTVHVCMCVCVCVCFCGIHVVSILMPSRCVHLIAPLQDIRKDVLRTDRAHPFYQGMTSPPPKLWAVRRVTFSSMCFVGVSSLRISFSL
jgi:hypothetical protein